MAEHVEHAKQGLNGVQKTAEQLYAVITEQAQAISTSVAEAGIIEVNSFRQIDEAARGLNTLYEVVRGILDMVNARRASAEQLHRETKQLIDTRLEFSEEPKPAPAWNGNRVIRAAGPVPQPGAMIPRAPATRPTARVPVAEGIQLEACIIATVMGETPLAVAEGVFDQVQTPKLHYYPPWNHFLLRIGSIVLHGGVGEVFDDRKKGKPGDAGKKNKRVRRQLRTTPCRNSKCAGGATCPFYHDPAHFTGSQEVRNYSNASWLYSPDSDPADTRAVRRLGSASQLTADIAGVRPQDAQLLSDQAMQSLLLALVACKYRPAR